jgi:acetyl-CoA carboxylase biotin carboxyl carrier protein
MVDLRKIKKLIELVEESGISEIEIREGEETVRISRQSPAPVQTIVLVPEAQFNRESAARLATPPHAPIPEVKPIEEPEGHLIKAPMVGTFYQGPSPSSPPFAEVGKRVKRGDVICIIEAMKVMNQIESDADGVVAAILVDTGQPVEYDQPLIAIKTA